MYVCMYVCMYVNICSMYVCMYVCMVMGYDIRVSRRRWCSIRAAGIALSGCSGKKGW